MPVTTPHRLGSGGSSALYRSVRGDRPTFSQDLKMSHRHDRIQPIRTSSWRRASASHTKHEGSPQPSRAPFPESRSIALLNDARPFTAKTLLSESQRSTRRLPSYRRLTVGRVFAGSIEIRAGASLVSSNGPRSLSFFPATMALTHSSGLQPALSEADISVMMSGRE